MVYCANCLHCKEKVENGGNYANGVWRSRYFRVCYCAKGVDEGPWENKPFRKAGSLMTYTMNECEFYDPIEPILKWWDIARICTHARTYDDLEWYYRRDKYKYVNHEHNVTRARKGDPLPTYYHTFTRMKYIPRRFNPHRLVSDNEFWENWRKLAILYKISNDEATSDKGSLRSWCNELARQRKVAKRKRRVNRMAS